MPSSMFDAYAAKICRHAELPPRVYESSELNNVIMSLPLAESHAVLDGVELENLPRLGETISLNEHMQRHFFDVIGTPSRELYEFTVPFLIRRSHLERLDGWRDWRTLTVYLGQQGLEPVVVFRNTPLPIKPVPFETVEYYVGDVRMILGGNDEYLWQR